MSGCKANRTVYCKHPDVWDKAKKIADAMGCNISEIIMSRLADYVQENEAKADEVLKFREQLRKTL